MKGGFLNMKENMQSVSKVGNIDLEMKEISKMQKLTDSYLSMWSNTCSGYYTLFCC